MKNGIVGKIGDRLRTIITEVLRNGGDFFIMNKSIEKFAIVREASAAHFEEMLNAKLFELSESSPVVEFDSVGADMVARIRYRERVEIENPKPSEVGAKFVCADCPHFARERNKDGSIDGRKKWGGCPFAFMERTTLDSEACDVLYNGIKNGDIGLTFKEEEQK